MISTATWEDILKESKNLISNSNSLKEREEEKLLLEQNEKLSMQQ